MALPIETPSRIWRRIEEGEARIGDMPSLPSLPEFDASTVDEGLTSALSLSSSSPVLRKSLSMKNTISPPSPASAGTNRYVDNEPTVKSSASGAYIPRSLRLNPVRSEDINNDASMITRLPESGSDEEGQVEDPERDKVSLDVGMLPCSGSDEEFSLSEALESISRTPSPLPLPNATFDIDGCRTGLKTQDFSHSEGEGSLGKSFSLRKFKDVAVRKPHDATRPPALSRSVSSLTSSTSSLEKSSPSHPGNEDSNRPFDSENVHGSDGRADHGRDAHEVQQNQLSQEGKTSMDERKDSISDASEVREPTFSSDDATSVPGVRSVHFPPVTSFPSAVSTPTPAYQSYKSIGRSDHEKQEDGHGETDDLETPLPRRKSFLLSVVNSTARPRMTFPTPHPRTTTQNSNAGFSPVHSRPFRVGTGRPRMSHPLSQIHTFEPITPSCSSPPGNDVDSTPGGGANNSFVSTASSHDLTVHLRANASFDPVTGPLGVGRFNAGKLNTYLHGLNRRLQEENEVLVERIRSQQLEVEALQVRLHRPELSGVMEDEGAELWVLEKEELEKGMLELQATVEVKEKELENEQKERMRDKERWRERMSEVEQGVGDIVRDLEKRLNDAEKKSSSLEGIKSKLEDARKEFSKVETENQLLKQRAEQAERIMASERDIGSELRRANDEKDQLERELQSVAFRSQQDEKALASSSTRIVDLEKETSSLKSTIRDLESSLRLAKESAETVRDESKELRLQQSLLRDELHEARGLISRLKVESTEATEKVKYLEDRLCKAEEKLAESEEAVERANEQVAISADELDRAKLTARQLEDALEESDRNISKDSKELAELRMKLASSEREMSRLHNQPQSNLRSFNDADVEALEAELAEATKEVGRLTALIKQSPARKAIEMAKDTRIGMLEKENEELLTQLQNRDSLSAYATPRRNTSMSGFSPMHRHLINMSMKTPRTPGEPLRDASWLLNMTGDVTAAHLMAEIGRLQKDLDIANESIDDKLDKLEEAGLGVVGLTKALENARRRISSLETELAELEGREDRRLEKSLCVKCGENELSKSLPRSSNTATLQLRLTTVTAELDALRKLHDEELSQAQSEKKHMQSESTGIQAIASRLEVELKYIQQEADRFGRDLRQLRAERDKMAVHHRQELEHYERMNKQTRAQLRFMKEQLAGRTEKVVVADS
ncbi:hypothetical protein DFH11DRAFT_1117187 [Phellopilus nigrolimitatus]|nr:hypothetical protein DFH11DRAFT_1117187 [Phellopilus nigrolimitatus]